MRMIVLTALGVGGATVFGAIIGFIFKKISHKFSDIVLSFAAGIMLAAAVLGLIIPSVEYGGKKGLIVTVAGIFVGAICINLMDKLVPHIHRFIDADTEAHNKTSLNKVLLFVIAIAIPQFVTLLLMQKILDGDGILNKILGTNILWLTDQRYFSLLPRLMIILVNIWIGVPYTLLMSSGILMNIPADYYEAARIDGAGAVRIFFDITLPYMLHITTPYLITQFVGNINNFNVIWLLTGGGPVDNVYYGGGSQAQSTDLLVTWLYRLTVDQNPKYNVASVIGIVIFVISAVLSLITFNRTSATKNEGAFQ